MQVDDLELESKAEAALDDLHRNAEHVAESANQMVAKHLHMMSILRAT